MQTNLTFYTSYSNTKPIDLCDSQCFSINDDTQENLGDSIITFNEYSKISVKFESDDTNAVLEIDSSLKEYPLSLSPSDTIVTISVAEDHDSMLTPGYYGVNIITSTKTYTGLYLVNSKSVSWEGLVNLRKYLETVMSGLSQNLYIERMVGQKNAFGDENCSLYKLYSFINHNIENVINSIDSIVKNPLTDIEKEYREQFYTKKEDVKSQRWLCTKGLSKNRNVYVPDIVFEKHSFSTKDTLENRYIKQIIQEILDVILLIEGSYQSIQFNSINKIKLQIELYKKNELSYDKLKNDRVVGNEFKRGKGNDLTYLKTYINELQNKSTFIDDILINLKKTKAMLLNYINGTWLEDITCRNRNSRISQKLLKDNRYYQIYDFYLNILDIEKDDPLNRKPYFPSKKTSKLFEYYSVSLIINILREDGFEWQNGWLADNIDNVLFNGEITTNKPMIFTKDNRRIEVVYEKEVETNTTIMNNQTNDFVRMNGTHYKPDIMLSLFNNDTGKIMRAIVIEVKCKKSRNLQSKNGPSHAIIQVKDYDQFGYYDKNKKTKNKIIKEVVAEIIILYPKQKDKATYDYDDMNITFMQIEANDTIDITKHFGYAELKTRIENCFFFSAIPFLKY